MTGKAEKGSGVRTIQLLKIAADIDNPFTLSSLAAEAGLPASSVHRLLQPLLREGLIERGQGQSYQIGSEMLRLASQVIHRADVGRLARPILRRLWSEWEETCTLCAYKPNGHLARVLETLPTPHPLRFAIEPFAELSLTWGSLGRAILASLPAELAAACIERPGVGPLSGMPAPTYEEMAPILAAARELGYSQYRNDQMDVAGVAAPVLRGDGRVFGSIGITAPARRMPPERVDAMAVQVKAAAQDLSALLGFAG